MNKNRKKNRETESTAEAKLKGFLDMIAPSVIQFYTDHYICGNTYRSVWALREYPTATDEQAILRHLGEKDGVTLRIYTRQVTPTEEKKIISNAANKNRMKQGNTENLQETVTAASNLQDVTTIISTMHRNREPLLHTAVFLELSAPDMEKLLDTELVLHKLYDDGAEAMLETKDEILSHDGLFGVEKDSWMNYLESQSQNETNGMIQEM